MVGEPQDMLFREATGQAEIDRLLDQLSEEEFERLWLRFWVVCRRDRRYMETWKPKRFKSDGYGFFHADIELWERTWPETRKDLAERDAELTRQAERDQARRQADFQAKMRAEDERRRRADEEARRCPKCRGDGVVSVNDWSHVDWCDCDESRAKQAADPQYVASYNRDIKAMLDPVHQPKMASNGRARSAGPIRDEADFERRLAEEMRAREVG